MNNFYEKYGLLNRIRESSTLFLFIIASFIASLIVMNILIFPIAVFSIKNNSLFTFLVKNIFWIIVICFIGFSLAKRIIFYKKNGMPVKLVIKSLIVRPFSFLLFILLVFIVIIALIASINFLLQKNYYIIYKIIKF